MLCDVCKRNRNGITWFGSAAGTLAVCRKCAPDIDQGLQQSLTELSARLSRCHSLTSVLMEILELALRITDADKGNIQLLDASGALQIRAQTGFSTQFLEFFNRVATDDDSACAAALAQRTTIVVEDVERSPIFVGTPALAVMLNAGVRAVQSTPMFDRAGSLVGIFSTQYASPRKISAYELKLVDLLARRAVEFIDEFQY
ncbi:MAG TPA: GAF domain-containing protein [Candidatus Binatus sp.]|nr:GAF domain-containing protein [Candidatus Binatus sp.]